MVGMYSDLRAMLARSNPRHLEAGPSLAEETLTARLLEIKRAASGSKRDTPPVGNSKRRSKRRKALTHDEIRQLRELFIRPVETERLTRPTDEELAAEREKEEGMFSMMRNQQELLCPNGSCREYACPFHSEPVVRAQYSASNVVSKKWLIIVCNSGTSRRRSEIRHPLLEALDLVLGSLGDGKDYPR